MALAPRPAHEYPRRILLAVIGLTPQIVTETLYKLVVDTNPNFIPTEIQIITTKDGAESAKVALFGTGCDKGWFHLFCEDYQLDHIQFDERNIHIITDPEGQFIDDNQSTEHNRIASDFITDKVKFFTQDDNTALHVSLAGGRKTMSYYAGYALSLYGRLQDRLSHTLVSEVFMSNKDFFYPRPKGKSRRLEIDKRFYSTESAKIILSDIPYVRMRYQVPTALLKGSEGFQETVHKIEQFNRLPRLVLYRDERQIEFNGTTVTFTDVEFALYYWFCLQILEEKEHLIISDQVSVVQFIKKFLIVYQDFTSQYGARFEKLENSIKLSEFDQAQESTAQKQKRLKYRRNWLTSNKTNIQRKMKKTLGGFAKPFLIQSSKETLQNQNLRYTYQLNILAERITIKRNRTS